MSLLAKVNPWLAQKIRHTPSLLNLIIETEPNRVDAVAEELQRITKIKVNLPRTSWNRFLPIFCPTELIPSLLELPYVKEVNYDMPKTIGRFTLFDPLIGEMQISKIEVPGTPLSTLALAPLAPISRAMDLSRPGFELLPTSKTRELMLAPDDNTVSTKVAVLDTGGLAPFHPLSVSTGPVISQTVIPEPPFDMLGHGSHCLSHAFVGKAPTRFGEVRSVADARNCLSVKCLNFEGFGTTSDVLRAQQLAYDWGAKVVNMSLGGPIQGSAIHDDPNCKIINETGDEVFWVVAAGNEGIPWSIGSPGAAPKALTVGSFSPKYGDVAAFSSRGPNGEFYYENQDVWLQDYQEAGEDMFKPDILAPGGGPTLPNAGPIDLIYSGCQGWADGEYDLSPGDGFDGMRGSSMGSAAAAGLCVLLHEKKGVANVSEIKSIMRQHWQGAKDLARGYGLLRYDYFN